MGRIGCTAALGVLCAVLGARPAQANPELFATYDSRSAALGGAGVAFDTTAAAPVHNVALLAGVRHFALTATFTPYALQLDSPFRRPSGQVDQVQSDWTLGPLGHLGVAVRLHKRLVVGASAFLPLGLASTYPNAPLSALTPYAGGLNLPLSELASFATAQGSLKPLLVMGELVIPASIELTPWLAVGGGYRMTYAYQSVSAQVGDTQVLALTMDAKNYRGYDVGVWFHPGSWLQAGVAYRSRVSQDYNAHASLNLKGATQELALTNPLGPFVAPHLVKGGVTLHPLGDSFMVTGEFRYFFYKDASNVLSQQQDDAFVINVGIESRLVSVLALRLGGAYGTQATQRAGASPFAPPPGASWIVTAGAGINLPYIDIDLAVGYGQEGTGSSIPAVGTAGRYHDQAVMASATANYHF
jgi:long-subunit fatty acid transport protein